MASLIPKWNQDAQVDCPNRNFELKKKKRKSEGPAFWFQKPYETLQSWGRVCGVLTVRKGPEVVGWHLAEHDPTGARVTKAASDILACVDKGRDCPLVLSTDEATL